MIVRPGQLSINIISNVVYYTFGIVISLWFTPYLIGRLGIAAYGIVPLTTTVVSYLSVVTLVLNAAVGRYITINLEKNHPQEAGEYFNTSLFASTVLVAILVVPCLFFALHPEWVLNLPKGQEQQTTILLFCTSGMFMLTVISTPFDVATYCRNRFDVRNAVAISASLLRVLLIVALFNLFHAEVWHVGIGILAATVLSFLGSLWAWRRLTPELVIDVRLFSIDKLKELTGTGGWIAVNQVGTILLVSIDLLVVNRLFGADAGGRYASILQWSVLLRGLGATIAGVLGPTIISHYARNQLDEMITYTRQAVKFMGLFIALPVGLISGLSKPLLTVWLGPDFVILAPLLSLMTFHLALNLGYLPLFNIPTVTNNVRIPGLLQILAGVVNLALALALAGPAGWGMYGVAAAGMIVLVLKNLVFTPLYVARIIGRNPGTFVQEIFPVLLISAAITLGSWVIASKIDLASWHRLIFFGITISCSYFTCLWLFVVNKEERRVLLKLLKLQNI